MLNVSKLLLHGFSLLALILVSGIKADGDGETDEISIPDSLPIDNNTTEVEANIRFLLYSDPRNLSYIEELKIDELETINNSSYNKNAPLKLLIHGFLSDCNKEIFPQDVAKAYLRKNRETKTESNIICVDWAEMANPPIPVALIIRPLYYAESVLSTFEVGQRVAKFLAFLADKEFLGNLTDVHIIGLSLGSHIAGIAGHTLQTKYKLKIGRITGLDPAGVFFKGRNRPLRQKLDTSDANFVDVVHTNMGKLGLGGKIGHVDYYVNGGRLQPACYQELDFISNLREQISGECSHMISGTYFKESILKKNIKACKTFSWEDFLIMSRSNRPCKNTISFGEDCPMSARGEYYLHL